MPALAHFATLPKPNDPQIQQAVIASIRLGHPIDTAGKLAGLGHTVAWDWLRKGLAQLEAGDEQGSHASFASAVKQAEAEMVDSKLKVIDEATKIPGKGWLPAMTLLERRRPKDFGRNQQIEVTSNSTVTYVHELGPRAESAILARREELAALQETDTGGSEDIPTPMLSEHTDSSASQD